MRQEENRYAIAVNRKIRSQIPANWLDQLEAIDGLTLVGPSRQHRVLAEATPKAIEQAKNLLGDYIHVEPLISHRTI